jgi:hypothetical protein
MKKFALGLAAAAGALTLGLGAASPASAALVLDDPSCDLFSATGCRFSDPGPGGANDNDVAAVETAYNTQHTEPPAPDIIDLNILGKIEAGDDFPNDLDEYDWTFDDVGFLVVKGGQYFVLYGFKTPQDFGTATSAGLLGASISHISFYSGTCDRGDCGGGGGNEVPEPSTWALMILGFGSAGAMLRTQRRRLARVEA